jgi:hypothetical protein
VGWFGAFAEGWDGISLGAGGLHDAERAEGAVSGAHHVGRLAMAATGHVGVQADALAGKVEAVHGPGVGCDGACGEPGFLGIHWVERDDRGDGRFIACGALFGEVAEWWRKCLGQDEQGVAGDGAREEGQGVDEGHGVAAPDGFGELPWRLDGRVSRNLFTDIPLGKVGRESIPLRGGGITLAPIPDPAEHIAAVALSSVRVERPDNGSRCLGKKPEQGRHWYMFQSQGRFIERYLDGDPAIGFRRAERGASRAAEQDGFVLKVAPLGAAAADVHGHIEGAWKGGGK